MFPLKARMLFSTLFSLFFSCAFSQTAQEITIPGYGQTAAASATPPPPSKKQISLAATPTELEKIIQSIDLSGWSTLSSYLWTCTPRQFSLVQAATKNKIQKKFDVLESQKKILTNETAIDIALKLTHSETYEIVGLWGDFCHIKLPNPDPSTSKRLDCLFTILAARTLSRLAYSIGATNGSKDPIPSFTLDAWNQIIEAGRCTTQ